MNIKTHQLANNSLIGTPVEVVEGKRAKAVLDATRDMIVDDRGLIHGGFTFSLADYAAMLAVNDPYVVLGSASVRFLAPVRVGEKLEATAEVVGSEGRKREVSVEVNSNGMAVFSGTFNCYVLDKHVLS